jgi:adenine-specific DNA-methyltransferase
MQKFTADDPETKSADVIGDNLEALKGLFPDAFSEGKVDFEVLKQLLGGAVDEGDEKYGLNWHGKRAARQLALTPSTGTLRPCPEESVGWDTNQNLMIEGDNLEVLKLLQKSYAGKVKMIFIDPPYNTGNDFIYPDDFGSGIGRYLDLTGQLEQGGAKVSSNTESSGRFHTRWLNMMYPRLRLAAGLLSSSGSLFVTIDDHEVANLREVLDEIFGYENFVATIAWQKVFAKKNKALISGSHDHILVYAKNIDCWRRNLLPRDESQLAAFKNPDHDPRGPWQSVSYSVQSEDSERRKDYRYEIELPSGRLVSPPAGRHWNGLPDRFAELRSDGRIWFGSDGDNPPRQKTFLSEVQDGIVPDTWWTQDDVGNNQEAKKEVISLFGESEPFSTPKPVRLIRRMLQIATDSDGEDIVLDFFAGSGTTGQAVMQANGDDGGDRRFILVQYPEPTGRTDYPTIADITCARLQKAIESDGVGTAMPSHGFRVFKLDSSNIEAWEPDREDLGGSLTTAIEHLRADRSEQDILFELLLKLGLELTVPIETRSIANNTVYNVGAGTLLVCLAESLEQADIEAVGLGIVAWHAELGPAGDSTVVFRDSAFADDVAKTNLTAILEQHGLSTVRSL